MNIAPTLLPLDVKSEMMVLRKSGKQQSLQYNPMLSSYGITDGLTLDFEVIGWTSE